MNESLVRDFINAVKAENKKTSAYDTQATVTRVDGGTAWVHIPGGVDETPIKMTVNAKEGDTVQIRVADGRAWIVGNETAPPTDDAKANEADKKAAEAKYLAVDAVDAALKADIAAQDAVLSAETAKTAAETAKGIAEGVEGIAEQARESASNASEYAARALGNLSTLQNVTETLTWITQHGTMALTQDTELDPTHVYFVRDNNGDYHVGSYYYSIVTEPNEDDLSTYYELTIDQSLNNYVGTHLALDTEGLWLLPATTGTYKILVSTGAGNTYTNAGTYILDSLGSMVAFFGAGGASFKETLPFRIGDASSYIQFDGNGHINIDGSGVIIGALAGIEEQIENVETELSGKADVNAVSTAVTEALEEPIQDISRLSERLEPIESELAQIFEVTSDGTILKGLKKVNGAIVEGEYYMKLTANGIYLYKTGEIDPIAYFQATGLDTPLAVTNQLQIGDWEFVQRDNGHLSLVYME